jgi:hypothetical protein
MSLYYAGLNNKVQEMVLARDEKEVEGGWDVPRSFDTDKALERALQVPSRNPRHY